MLDYDTQDRYTTEGNNNPKIDKESSHTDDLSGVDPSEDAKSFKGNPAGEIARLLAQGPKKEAKEINGTETESYSDYDEEEAPKLVKEIQQKPNQSH